MGSKSNGMKVFKLMVNAGHLLGFYPYYFQRNSSNLELRFDSSKGTELKLLGNIGNIFVYQIYLIFRCAQAVSNDSFSFRTRVNSLFVTVLYVLFNFGVWITLRHYGDHHKLFNEVMKTKQEIKENLNCLDESVHATKNESQKPFIQCLAFTATFATIMRASGALLKPGSPELYTSLAASPNQLQLLIRVFGALTQFMLSGFISYGVVIHGMFIFLYITSTQPLIRQLKYRTKHNASSSNCSLLLLVSSSYLKLQLLQRNFNHIYGIWPLGFEVGALLMTIVRLFLAIIAFSSKDLVIGVFMLLTALLIFKAFAEIYDDSIETLESWKGVEVNRDGWMAKFREGCAPIRVSVGGFYYADKGLVLTIISIVLSSTLNLVLGYKK